MRHKATTKSTPATGGTRALGPVRLVAGVLALLLAAACLTGPFTLMILNDQRQEHVVDQHEKEVRALQAKRRKTELAKARQYNQRLAEDGQEVMGEAMDPWSGDATIASKDKTYNSLLATPEDGIMSRVRYPRLDIDLPVRHGSGQGALAAGAGHMYGSSLPVGGRNTNSVITAHTGLASHVMFDQLSLRRGKTGDIFYIDTLGKTMAYQVRKITVVSPSGPDGRFTQDDFRLLKIQEGRDLVTLLTCTPYGVNTQRLVVTGERVSMPDPAPAPEDQPGDWVFPWLVALAILAAWTLAITVTIVVVRRNRRAAMGAGGRPKGRHKAE